MFCCKCMNVNQIHVALKVEHSRALIDNCTTVLVRLKSNNITMFRYFTFLMKTTGTVFLISDEQKKSRRRTLKNNKKYRWHCEKKFNSKIFCEISFGSVHKCLSFIVIAFVKKQVHQCQLQAQPQHMHKR